MHELSIALNMIDIAVNHAQSANAKKINEIEIEVGELSGVVSSALEFCFEAACQNTIAEGSDLKLLLIPGIGECQNCKAQFSISSLFSQCEKCKSFQVNTIQGQELRIKSIVVD